MSEKPPPDGINYRSLRRLRDRQFIPSAAEDARPSAQASLRLRSRLAARRPTGSLTLRPPLRLNAWTRDWRSQRTIWVHAEGLNLSNSVIITLFVLRLELLWCELYLCYETVFPGIRSQAFRGGGKSERLFYFKTGRGSGV